MAVPSTDAGRSPGRPSISPPRQSASSSGTALVPAASQQVVPTASQQEKLGPPRTPVATKLARGAETMMASASKAIETDGFVAKETGRLQKMIDDGSVKASKKEQFGRRLNILSSFA